MANSIVSSSEVARLNALAPAPLWIGYSGGLDSTVLLHWLAARYPIEKITAIHINHQLHPAANDWQAHAQQFCQQLGVNWQCQTIQVSTVSGQSLEEAARTARYTAFATIVPPAGHLVLAHHRQDQMETVLLQLLRGSGVRGLAGMPVVRNWRGRSIHRWMLTTPHADILQYAQDHRLPWVEDETNGDVAFARNQIRHHWLPLMRQQWPSAEQTITRSAHLCGEAVVLMDALAEMDYAQCKHVNEHQLSLPPLLTLSPARQRNVLRYWITRSGYRVPNHDKLIALQRDVLSARFDANPVIRWANVELRRYRDSLYLQTPLPPLEILQRWPWDLSQPLTLPLDLGRLSATPVAPGNPDSIALPVGDTRVTVGLRQGGESCYLPGRVGRRSLKKLCQTWGIPPWQRARLPLVFYQDQFICIPGWLYGELASRPSQTTCWQLAWIPTTGLVAEEM